jgi:hypothetical protein
MCKLSGAFYKWSCSYWILLGFHQCWLETLIHLVTIVSFLFLFNGDRLDSFKLSRAIQRSYLSLSVFLGAEGLLCLLKDRNQLSILNGIKVVALRRWHVVFLELLGKVHKRSMRVLKIHCQPCGQRINVDKSLVHFAKG